MQKTVYEDYKYSMQDTSRVYVGSKYTLRELLEADEVYFTGSRFGGYAGDAFVLFVFGKLFSKALYTNEGKSED